VPGWGIVNQARAFRNRKLYQKLFERDRSEFYSKLYSSEDAVRILSGPFRGMSYHNTSAFGPIAPKWLGSYENEIWDWIEHCCANHYENIVNVGSADGYYAVGLVWRCSTTRVFAYDIDPFARQATLRLAQANGLADRLLIRSECSYPELSPLRPHKTLLIIDIEGTEVQFLDPAHCSALKEFDMIVELHESAKFGTTIDAEKILSDRFGLTHALQRRSQTDRTQWCAENREVWSRCLTEEEVSRATNEFRTCKQAWLWLQAKD
jgi:hypothetical protein